MRLSIITVNLNNKDGLRKTIDSVVSQTFQDFEWIVIDGGSTDGSKELLEQYADHFSYWVSEPDKGIYNAMNKGIKKAQGEYLQFLNSGDWLVDKTALERCFAHNFSADIAYGDLYFCNGAEKEVCHYPQSVSFRFFYLSSIGHPTSFIKRSILRETLYDEGLKIVSDWKFFLVQAMRSKRFEHIDEIVCCFDTKGISSVNPDLANQERQRVIREIVPELIEKDYIRMDEMDALLGDPRVKKVLEYSKKKVLYRKMITASLSVIGFIDRSFGKKR